MTQVIAMSCVPEDISSITNQVEQLKRLVKWFPTFFSWCNQPKCTKCGDDKNQERFGDETPNAEDREYGASRIESYRCRNDGVITRFPRYNNPVKLFDTRTGRCGEYANAFTAICIALGHKSRKCLDWTDHVWTEVYVDEFKRWVHLDSCDAYFDEPLAYEKGWGKNLTYVIATSNEEIVDVTKRYVLDPMLNRMRREKVNEKWLEDTIKQKRESMW